MAARRTLARQVLIEGAVFGLFGTIIALFVAWIAVTILRLSRPVGLPRLEAIRLDTPVLWFSLVIGLGSNVATTNSSRQTAWRRSAVFHAASASCGATRSCHTETAAGSDANTRIDREESEKAARQHSRSHGQHHGQGQLWGIDVGNVLVMRVIETTRRADTRS